MSVCSRSIAGDERPSGSLGFRRGLCALVALGSLALAPGPEVASAQSLRLEVQESRVINDGVAAISLRTFRSRPVSQGQLCLRALNSVPSSPLSAINSSTVFSGNADASSNAFLVPDNVAPEAVMVTFESPTQSINDEDGPLLVVYVQVRDDLVVGEVFPVEIDLPNSFLLDASGTPIPIDPVDSILTVVGDQEDLEIEIEGEDDAYPGGDAYITIETDQIVGWSSASFDVHYPDEITDGPVEVLVDPRVANANVTVTENVVGILEIRIDSPDDSLNLLPGDLVEIVFPVRADTAPNSVWPVSIQQDTAEVLNANGSSLGIEIENGVLEIGSGEIFSDGFEDGDVGEWDDDD